MSVTVNILNTGTNGSAAAFAKEIMEKGLVDSIRNEQGNERYEYFYSAEDPESVVLIDQWRDQEALDIHHALPVMAEIAALRDKYDLHMKVERFIPQADLPEQDQAFIRKQECRLHSFNLALKKGMNIWIIKEWKKKRF